MHRCARPTCIIHNLQEEQYVLVVSRTDDEPSTSSCKKDLIVGNVDTAFFWIRLLDVAAHVQYLAIFHAARRRTRSISSFDELTE